MNTRFRRYELRLPGALGDGQSVPEEFIAAALVELGRKLQPVPSAAATLYGGWQAEGHVHRGEWTRVFIDVPDVPESRQFFVDFKERLKARFRQIDIRLTSHPIDVL
jgi:hypothetical protein